VIVIDHRKEVHYADPSLLGIPLFPHLALIPNVKRWELHGELKLVHGFNLSRAESLELCFSNWGSRVMIVPLSRNLMELNLAKIYLTQKTIRRVGRYSLPNLTTLRLVDIAVEGSLHDYFEVPRLKVLQLTHVRECTLGEEDINEPDDGDYLLFPQVLFRPSFIGLPYLESLVLQKVIMGRSVTRAFGLCVHLNELVLENCNIKGFINTCAIDMVDKAYLPSLSLLKISGSWPSGFDISYKVFMNHCRAQRPGLLAYGDADTYKDSYTTSLRKAGGR
jgi:hypothetical protein